jgi:hypothetical protein
MLLKPDLELRERLVVERARPLVEREPVLLVERLVEPVERPFDEVAIVLIPK